MKRGKVSETWKTLNRSIYTGERLKDNLKALTVAGAICTVLGAVLVVINLVTTRDAPMLFAAVMTTLFGALCAYFAGVKKRRDIAVIMPFTFCLIAFTLYALTAAGDGTAILWTVILPIGMSYFVSVKYGILMSAYYSILFFVLFYTPLRANFVPYYSISFLTRFPVLYTALAVMTDFAMIQYHKSVLFQNEYADRLHREVEKQTAVANFRAERLAEMSNEAVEMLAMAIDAKDRYTNGHSQRVAAYASALAKRLGWSEEEVRTLEREALLHDIGKIGIPDAVLNKPGRLSEKEFQTIQSHASIGGAILSNSHSLLGAADVARAHHERWDGSGYPAGLAGEKIPLHARVVSIADAYDAMRSNRVYRAGLAPERIRAELVRGRGTQFAPAMLDAFLTLVDSGEMDAVTAEANAHLAEAVELGLFDSVG